MFDSRYLRCNTDAHRVEMATRGSLYFEPPLAGSRSSGALVLPFVEVSTLRLLRAG
jgi:hypothetical protein